VRRANETGRQGTQEMKEHERGRQVITQAIDLNALFSYINSSAVRD